MQRAISLGDVRQPFGQTSVTILDDFTVTKGVLYDSALPVEQQHEALNMKFVFEHTTIPVPRVYMVVAAPNFPGEAFIVMDYIHGHRLDHAWPMLSVWSKLRVAWVLRSYFRQLRSIKLPYTPIPGPLGPVPQLFPEGTIHSLRPKGPFADADALNTFLNERANGIRGVAIPPEYEKPEPLVFTHADVNMRNVILGYDGRVWLIDWDWSGFYPRSWEFITMARQAENHPTCPTPRSWKLCVPFITGPHFKRYRWNAGFPP